MAQAGTNFPKVRRMLLYFSLFIFKMLLASLHAASRAHRSCHSVSSWDRSSKFGALGLRWWGSPGQIIPSDGFWSRMLPRRTRAFVNFTHRISFRMFELFREIVVDFSGSISWITQPNCRVLFSIATALFITILVLFMALAPTLMVRAPALEVRRMKSSMPSFHSLHNSKSRSRKFLLSRLGRPIWIHISRKRLVILRPDMQRWNRISAPSLHVCAKSRHMLHQHQIYQVRQDPGLHANKLTAPQPLGPMAQYHLVTIRTRDADLMFP